MNPDPASVVADADVLLADLFVDGTARDALDLVRKHDWMTLVASEPLLDDAAAIVATKADPDLAADWRDRIEAEASIVDHPPGDHPALASALTGGAGHLLTLDETLASPRTNAAVSTRVQTSVRLPDAFVHSFDAASLYEAVEGGSYPGPDRDPRS
ncbi:DUF7384 family protein [Halanaeroarchaeum sulfurireducens]|uniref:PIN domain-containing protein n=1 Tax=Halanaeroarchaeum sulfurireducens TaxID=1604004 RepID=A0A0F7PFW8_9EURY|nr:hypothetical protein [Halanaeroarchaeum sulfurireducens]AKH98444.1 hypothetical protein HLASF_1977 [Halanaeroarchaeum sulfurireducens]ALG82838.1 hypothetical protein HLASA_1963 [Halanaeroarchaeum sulfurireducens]